MNSGRSKTVVVSIACALVCLFGLAACSQEGAGSSGAVPEGATGGVAATVNGVEISEDEVTDFIQAYRASSGLGDEESWGTYLASSGMTPESFRAEVIDYFVSQKLIAQAAEEMGIEATDEEVDEQVETMRAYYADDEAWEEALASAGTTEEDYRESVRNSILSSKVEEKVGEDAEPPSDEDMLEYVQMYKDYFDGSKRSSHILFNTEDKDTAQEVLDKINDGSLSFEDAVAEYSQDSSASNGGDVGWDMLNSFVEEYTDALGELDKDEISDLVESTYGYHIIKVTDVYEAPEGELTSLDGVPEEMVDYIRSMLESSNASNAVYEWYDTYEEEADIQINDMPSGLPYDVDMSLYETADEEGDDSSLVVELDGEDDDASSDDSSSSDAGSSDEGSSEESDEESSEASSSAA